MPLSIKVNLRVTGHCNQGGRKYMEDMFSVAYQQTSDDKDLEYAFFGIFDGHGGGEAATFAKEHLMDIIVKQKNFWSDKDEDVLRAIRDGYVNTHYAMWRELDKWPRTASGLPSTAGTTASIAFIRKGKIYIGHVGDSGIILGYQDEDDPHWKAKPLTKDHKPESVPERTRIHESGGKVISKSGVPRVVWNRPRIGHKGPVRRSTHIDEIPFLAVARSLGDLWSYNSELDTFVVSPEPDVRVVTVDVKTHRCLIFGTDGLWNMLSPQRAVSIVQEAEKHNEMHFVASQQTGNGEDTQMWMNPSKSLVDHALKCWSSTRLRADNTSVVTLMLDPPGPSRGEVLLSRKKDKMCLPKSIVPPLRSAPAVSPLLQDFCTPRSLGSLEKSQNFCGITPIPDKTSGPEETPASARSPHQAMYSCPLPAHQTTADVSSKSSETPGEPTAKTPSQTLETLDISSSNSGASASSPQTSRTSQLSSESEKSSASIQVAEVSSSDAALFQNDNDPVSNRNEVSPGEEEKPDSPSKDFPVLKPRTPPNNLQKLLLSPSDSVKIARQNTFSAPCEELKNGPGLRRSGQFGIQCIKDVSATSQPRRRPHSSMLDKRGPVLISRCELRSTKRCQAVVNHSQMMPATSSSAIAEQSGAEGAGYYNQFSQPLDVSRERSTKRRHSSTFEKPEENLFASHESNSKRRTRSEDRGCPRDENDPDNQAKQIKKLESRIRWPVCAIASKSRNSLPGTSYGGPKESHQDKIPSPGYQRRSLEKKATPVKTIRRPSINGINRVQLRGSFAVRDSLSSWDQSKTSRRSSYGDRRRNSLGMSSGESANTPQMWLRSDTIAATSIKTLRSRNVDIDGHTVPPQVAHQYGIVKQNRSLGSKIAGVGKGKMKAGTSLSSGGASGNSSGNVGGIAKRVKAISPYNPSARSLNTRSRLKRLGK